MQEVRQERTGWRDLGLNDRHRLWGYDCPAVDIDFVEYDEGIPIAIFEYKNERVKAESIKLEDSKIRALSTLGECASKPFFVVRYKSDYSMYHILPMNSYAKKILIEKFKLFGKEQLRKGICLEEESYVRFLLELRGYDLPQSVIDKIKEGSRI